VKSTPFKMRVKKLQETDTKTIADNK
jgi:hypothetical protein